MIKINKNTNSEKNTFLNGFFSEYYEKNLEELEEYSFTVDWFWRTIKIIEVLLEAEILCTEQCNKTAKQYNRFNNMPYLQFFFALINTELTPLKHQNFNLNFTDTSNLFLLFFSLNNFLLVHLTLFHSSL